ncbi:ABC transporter permease [Halanaerocella petrolearia]
MSTNIITIYQEIKDYGEKISQLMPTWSKKSLDVTKLILVIIVSINLVFITLIVTSLFFKTSINKVISIAQDTTTLQALKITITSIFCSIIITIICGIPLAYITTKKDDKTKRVINLILSIPLVLPPAVAGLALLMTFGRRGILGGLFIKLNLDIPFTFLALILVQVFTMLPLFTHSLKSGFESVDKKIEEAAMVYGAGEKEVLLLMYLPLSMRSFMTGVIMSCLRAAGEFGATIMFAGNLKGKTQTLSTAIYTLSQKNIEQAISLAVVLIVTFLVPLFVLELSKGRGK